MQLFPKQKYSITLLTDSSKALAALEKVTLSDDQFVANWKKQNFLGKVNATDFQIKLSKKLYGGFCDYKGRLEIQNGTIEIGVSKTIKVLAVALFFLSIIGFLVALFGNTNKNTTQLLVQTILFILILRYVFIEMGFRVIAKMGLRKLAQILEIDTLQKLNH